MEGLSSEDGNADRPRLGSSEPTGQNPKNMGSHPGPLRLPRDLSAIPGAEQDTRLPGLGLQGRQTTVGSVVSTRHPWGSHQYLCH